MLISLRYSNKKQEHFNEDIKEIFNFNIIINNAVISRLYKSSKRD